ncbi:hypothetical protein HPB47_023042, partial [Ixodes persulcatus]
METGGGSSDGHMHMTGTNTERKAEELGLVWQWNCRGYRRKRGSLTQFLATRDCKPVAIALQETGNETEDEDEEPRVATLVAKHVPVIEHKLAAPAPHVFRELLARGRGKCSLFLLNVYSSPKRTQDVFDKRFRYALRITCPRRNNLLILGNFNAPHGVLGYPRDTPKGRKLMVVIENLGLTLLNKPWQPTRMGNSVSRDTCPDISLVKARGNCNWVNLQENLGSDHHILEIAVPNHLGKKRGKPQTLTNWDSFRQLRIAKAEGIPITQDNGSLERWVEQVQADVKKASKTVLTTDQAPEIDPHLLHLWDARHGLTKRWKKQKLNRTFRKRIAELTQEAEQYAEDLTQANWHRMCDQLQGTLGTKKTWSILRNLLDPTKAKTETNKALAKLLHTLSGKERTLLRRLGYDGHPTRKEEESERKPAHPTIAAKIRTMPIPRNMHPIVHAGRRLARVRYLRRRYQDDPDVLYADAASYSTPISGRRIAVCGPNGERRAAASLLGSPSVAEPEAAIALAITSTQHTRRYDPNETVTLLTDSQAACRAWAGGLLSKWSRRILAQLTHEELPLICILWTPGHTLLQGNESANSLARGLTFRAARHGEEELVESNSTRPVYNRQQSDDETEERPTQSICPGCNSPTPTLYHCTWACPTPLGEGIRPIPNPSTSSWETALLGSGAEQQRELIARARKIAVACGALD